MDCITQTELTYDEFSSWIRKKAPGKRVPLSGSFELTFRCNLRCVHCYLDGQHEPPPELQELTTAEIYDIIDQIVAEGCLWLLLTGGEPLVRPDWRDIYLYAKRKGLILTLFTNGTLITPEDADFLAAWRPKMVEISLYGATKETYERITGIPGSYERCKRGIQLLVDRGIPLKLKTPLMTLNRDELELMRTFAAEVGVAYDYDPILRPTSDGSLAPYQYRLQPQEIVAIEREDPHKMLMWEKARNEHPDQRGRARYLYVCRAGIETFHIDPYGNASMCMTAREPNYDLRKGSFHDAWMNFIPTIRKAVPTDEFICGKCNLRPLCPQCPALSRLESGDPEQLSTYLCELTHRRAGVGFSNPQQTELQHHCLTCPQSQKLDEFVHLSTGD